MAKIQVDENTYNKMLRDIAKLNALEAGGVDNWEGYSFSLEEWHKENALDEILDEIISDMNDILVEADIEQPAGSGCGYSITFDEIAMKKLLKKRIEEYMDEIE